MGWLIFIIAAGIVEGFFAWQSFGGTHPFPLNEFGFQIFDQKAVAAMHTIEKADSSYAAIFQKVDILSRDDFHFVLQISFFE